MSKHPEPKLKEMLQTIALARIILNPNISIQAPPNLEKKHLEYVNAGINDWGGISPVTKDFINPQHPWPNINVLESMMSKIGFRLMERLTVYPKFNTQDFLHFSPCHFIRSPELFNIYSHFLVTKTSHFVVLTISRLSRPLLVLTLLLTFQFKHLQHHDSSIVYIFNAYDLSVFWYRVYL